MKRMAKNTSENSAYDNINHITCTSNENTYNSSTEVNEWWNLFLWTFYMWLPILMLRPALVRIVGEYV